MFPYRADVSKDWKDRILWLLKNGSVNKFSVIVYIFWGSTMKSLVQPTLKTNVICTCNQPKSSIHTLNSGSRWWNGSDAFCLKNAQASGVANVKQSPKTPNVAGRVNQGYLHSVPLFSK